MGTIEYNLYRIKFIKSKQTNLFNEVYSPSEIFYNAINEKPTLINKLDYTWHIGNIEPLRESSGYFRVGRTTKRTVEKYDEESGDFVDQTESESPYTHVIYNLEIGFLGIAKKLRLAPTTKGIANTIKKLMLQTKVVRSTKVEVEIDPISDPEGFLNKLSSAYAIKKFTATFTGPNPFDADEYFQKPLSKLLKDANGQSGKTVLDGNDLDNDVLQEITKSTAATGNTASALIQSAIREKPKKYNLSGDPIKKNYDEENHDIQIVADDLLHEYLKVRK